MTELPNDTERLLSVDPQVFVGERQRLVRELRAAGRSEDASTVASLRKPPPVVLAVNRAARARPKAAEAASDAAVRVKKAQVGDDREAFKGALADLQQSLDLLAEVAVTHVAPHGKRPSEAMRRRVYGLLRSAVADDEARQALVRGVLTEEIEAPGFDAFVGMAPTRAGRRRSATTTSPRSAREAKRRERERSLREELALAEQKLKEAERSVQEVEEMRTKAQRLVTSIRAKLERL